MTLVETVPLAGLADGCPVFLLDAFDILKYTSTIASVIWFADLFTFFHDILLSFGADFRPRRIRSRKAFVSNNCPDLLIIYQS